MIPVQVIRHMLDHTHAVDEAVEILGSYNLIFRNIMEVTGTWIIHLEPQLYVNSR